LANKRPVARGPWGARWANGEPRTLTHETTDALGIDCEQFSRDRAELIVDAVVFCPG
jgi:hypothetical protein